MHHLFSTETKPASETKLTYWELLGLIGLSIVIFFVLTLDDSNVNLSDTLWVTHVYASIAEENNTDLNEFVGSIESRDFYAIRASDESLYSFFPLGTPLLATPILFVLESLLPEFNSETLYDHLIDNSPESAANIRLHLYSASAIVTLTAVVLYLLFRHYLTIPQALFFTLLFGFGTSAYSLASRALWQHGPSMLMLALTLLFIVREESGKKGIQAAGFALACAYLIRPSNSIPILIFSAYILICHPKQFGKFLLASLPVAVWFFAYNLTTFDALFHPYYVASQLELSQTAWVALAGNLFSPSRGLFIFSPFLIFVPILLFQAWRHKKIQPLDIALILIIGLHWIAISLFPHWYGGDSFGPRFFSDMLPLFFVLLVRHLPNWLDFQGQKAYQKQATMVFIVLALFSVVIHHTGATKKATWAWNYQPLFLDLAEERLWDWQNSQLFSAFSNQKTGLALIDFDQEGQNSFELQLSNMTATPQYWEFIYPSGLKIERDDWFSKKLNNQNFLASRQTKPVQPFDISFIQLVFDEGSPLNQKIIQLNVYEDRFDGEPIDQKFISLDSLSPTGVQIQAFPEKPDLPPLQPNYGSGWFDVETLGDFSWRWAKSPSLVYFESSEAQPLQLKLVFGDIFDPAVANGKGAAGKLILTLNGSEKIEVPIRTGEAVFVPLVVEDGFNTLQLELEAGNFSPNQFDASSGDLRELSFIVNELSLDRE